MAATNPRQPQVTLPYPLLFPDRPSTWRRSSARSVAPRFRSLARRAVGGAIGVIDNWDETAFVTRAIHAGQDPDPTTGAIITPIYQTSTFVQQAVGEHQGYEYARTDNPTRTALQTALASLEGGAWALAYASGLAATQNVFYLL